MNNNEESSQNSLELIKQNYNDENEDKDGEPSMTLNCISETNAHDLDTTTTTTTVTSNNEHGSNDVFYKISVSKHPFQIKSIKLMNNDNETSENESIPCTSGYDSISRSSSNRTQKRQYETILDDKISNGENDEISNRDKLKFVKFLKFNET